MPDPELRDRLRALPSVESLLQTDPLRSAARDAPHGLAVEAARAALERGRDRIRNGDGGEPSVAGLAEAAAVELERRLRTTLRRVINATGVIVHTNLGRAPLAAEAIDAVELVARGYSTLEYDLDRGVRGSRHAHVERLIAGLTGAEAGFAVNNNAAAVLLALAALAWGREVVISRGQLVEIGGSFRIPDILAASGARLVEVGTTNRTRLADYERAIGDATAALMRVHASNFRTVGFTEEVGIEDLAALAAERGVAMIDDLGSGVLDELEDEPSARRSVAAGVDVVCFSGDKLLGGPQAGLIAGRRSSVERLRSHPLARALRIDKLSLAALESTLRLHEDPARASKAIPVLRMFGASERELASRAERIRDAATAASGAGVLVEVVRSDGRVGGGALPLLELEGPAVAIRTPEVEGVQEELRRGDPPVIARVHDGALLLDPRTMTDDEVGEAITALRAALGRHRSD